MAALEIPAGTMSPQSRFYMPRASDAIALEAIDQQGVTITELRPMGNRSARYFEERLA